MKSDRRNIGIDVLKALACAGVVIQHFGGGTGGGVRFAVPVFMFTSIYLSGNTIQHGNVGQLLRRMKRLYIPFAAWGMLYFLAMCLIERRFNVADLFLQLTIGVPACPPLYFMFLLAANTLLLFLVARCGRYSMALLAVIFASCLVLQYAGLNVRIFAGLPFHPQHALGRFAELLPAAICGYCLFLSDRKWLVTICATLLFSFAAVAEDCLHCPGFSYQGVYVLCGAACVSSVAISLGERVLCESSKGVGLWTVGIAGLTAGIYYVHLIVGKGLEAVGGRHRSIKEAMAVLLLSAGLVFVMKRMRKLAWMVV